MTAEFPCLKCNEPLFQLCPEDGLVTSAVPRGLALPVRWSPLGVATLGVESAFKFPSPAHSALSPTLLVRVTTQCLDSSPLLPPHACPQGAHWDSPRKMSAVISQQPNSSA